MSKEKFIPPIMNSKGQLYEPHSRHFEHDTKLVFLGMALHPTKAKTDKVDVIPQMRFYCYECNEIFSVDTKFGDSTFAWKKEIERSFAASQLHTA